MYCISYCMFVLIVCVCFFSFNVYHKVSKVSKYFRFILLRLESKFSFPQFQTHALMQVNLMQFQTHTILDSF